MFIVIRGAMSSCVLVCLFFAPLIGGSRLEFFSKSDGSAISNITAFCALSDHVLGERILRTHPLLFRPMAFHFHTFGVDIEVSEDGEAYFLLRNVLHHSNGHSTLVLRGSNVSVFSLDHVRKQLYWVEDGFLNNFDGRLRPLASPVTQLEVSDGITVMMMANRSVFVDERLVVEYCDSTSIPFFVVRSDPLSELVVVEDAPSSWLSLFLLLLILPFAEAVRRTLHNRRVKQIEAQCCCTSVLESEDASSSRRSPLPLLHKKNAALQTV